MKWSALTCAVVAVSMAGVSQAADREIGKGSTGLLFSFGGLSTLSANAYGGGLGAKYFVTPELAIRGNLLLNTASSKDPANPPTGQTGLDGSQSATSFGLGAAAEYHLGAGKVSPYVGAGLNFMTTSTSSKNASVGNPPPPQTQVDNAQGCEAIGGRQFCAGSGFGLAGIAGVEFFPMEHVSLAAEYQLGYSSIGRADEKTTNGPNTTTTKVGSNSGIGITSLGLLTLGIYFM